MPAITMPPVLAALGALASVAIAAGQAWAAPPPIIRETAPPGRVGRVARLNGTVSAHAADADQWSPATLNAPVTSGDAFWTEPRARADLQIASNRLTMAPQTELDVSALDDNAVTVSEPQGETVLVLRALAEGDIYTVQTPRGAVQIATAGRYAVIAGDTAHPTVVTVLEGAAQMTGPGLSLQIGPHQTATITGSDPLQGTVGPVVEDAFLTAMLAEDQPAPRQGAAIPALVAGMTGCEDLRTVGDWAETPQYGTVWYPPVQAGWVPYREGRWSFVRPWGWTWVDDAPWGFAPFHYGRWAEIDHRWGWIPVVPGVSIASGPSFRGPFYAPALVGFIGLGVASAVGQVGWVPLGPREAYMPPYRASPAYIRTINVGAVVNVNQTNIVNRTTIVQNYINRGAVTVVPAAAMVRSSPIAGEVRPIAPDQLARAQALNQIPVRPSAATAGVTAVVARQFNFVPPVRAAQPAPGPALRTAAPQGPIPQAPTPQAPTPQAPTSQAPTTLAATPQPRQPAPEARPADPVPEPRPAVRAANPAQPSQAAQPSREPRVPAVPRPLPRPAPRTMPASRAEPMMLPPPRLQPRPVPQFRPAPQPRLAPQPRPAPPPVVRPMPRPAMPVMRPQPRPEPPHAAAGPHRR